MTDAENFPWPTEEVNRSELRVGDVVKHAGPSPWVTIVQIVEASESQPEWERSLGDRLFRCEALGSRKIVLIYDQKAEDGVAVRRRTDGE
jgi:hypothetical protein